MFLLIFAKILFDHINQYTIGMCAAMGLSPGSGTVIIPNGSPVSFDTNRLACVCYRIINFQK